MPYGVVHLRQPRARVHLPPGVVGFLALRRLQRPFPSVVGHAGQFALPVHRLDVIRDDAPAEHIRVSVVDGEVVKKRQVFQAADDDVVVILLQDRLRHPLQHTDAPLIAGKVPPSLPFLVHRVAPSGHHHQRFWRMVHAARHLFVRIEHHTERVGRCVHRQDAHPTRIKTPAARCQVIHDAIDDVMLGKGRKVVLPSLAHLEGIGTVFFQRHRLDGSAFAEGIVPFHGRQAVENQLQHLQRRAHLQAFELTAPVREDACALTGRHRVDELAELQEEVGAVFLVFAEEHLGQFGWSDLLEKCNYLFEVRLDALEVSLPLQPHVASGVLCPVPRNYLFKLVIHLNAAPVLRC